MIQIKRKYNEHLSLCAVIFIQLWYSSEPENDVFERKKITLCLEKV